MTSAPIYRIITCFLFLSGFALTAMAGQRQNVSAGWGYGPVASAILWPSGQPYGPGSVQRHSPGSLFLEYGEVRKSWLDSSLLVDIAHVTVDVNSSKEHTELNRSIISVMYMWRFLYFDKGMFRVYSSVGVGLATGFQHHDYSVRFMPIVQLVPVGASIGRNVFLFGETGVGLSLLGVRMGIGYSF